jgi:hypothetical protein
MGDLTRALPVAPKRDDIPQSPFTRHHQIQLTIGIERIVFEIFGAEKIKAVNLPYRIGELLNATRQLKN